MFQASRDTLQRKGAFETAGFDPDGELVGVDFTIVAGEGYFIYMN